MVGTKHRAPGNSSFVVAQTSGLMKKAALPLRVAGSGGEKKEKKWGRDSLVKLLRWHFGHAEFRGLQLEAIEAVLSGKRSEFLRAQTLLAC